MKLIKPILLGTMLVSSPEILAVPVLQNAVDKNRLSNPDAETTPVLVDSTMTGKVATLYYPWNAIKILPHPENGIPKIAFTASPKGVLVTATVSLAVHWLQLRESVDDFKATHPNWQQVNLVPIHPEEGKYAFALRLANGKSHYFAKRKVENTIPTNQVVVSLGLAGKPANDLIHALMNGAVMEIHYQYQFSALTKAQNATVPVQVHRKLELNGYCDAFPRLFNYQSTAGGLFEQGCLPNMKVTDIPETLNREQICEILPEICEPAPTLTNQAQPTNTVDDELAEYCQIFPDDQKCQKPKMASLDAMKEICETEPHTPKCAVWNKIEQEFVSCFFDQDCHTFNINYSISE